MIRLTKHAAEAMGARGIPFEWVAETLLHPDWRTPDLRYADYTRAFKAIAALGNRVIRVVVITVHLDRDAKP